jgi:FkbM family methyltransferase
MNSLDPQATKDREPYRFDLRRLAAVRKLNIVLTLIFITLLIANGRQIGRRIEFWRTGKVNIDGLMFYLNPQDEYLTQLVLSSGTWEPEETRLFRSKCRTGDTVIDVGANIGWYTIIASKLVGKNGSVIAFEPDPENYEFLKRNILANECDNVILEPKALSNVNGTLTLYLDDENKGKHSIVFDQKGGAIQIEAIKLDDYLENRLKQVDFVKIDVEGAEPMVLEGMKRTIASHPSIRLVVEFSPERVVATGQQPKPYLEGFIEQGFGIYIIDEGRRQVVPATPTEILAKFDGYFHPLYTNLFLQRDSN